MSDAISPIGGRTTEAFVTVRGMGPRGMITLRGDLSSSKLMSVCTALAGVDFPEVGHANCVGEKGLCWMSPDEVLILVPYDQTAAALDTLQEALSGTHHLAANVSDARALILLEGAGGREVLAKLAPVDLHPDSFGPGQFRRTRLGQIAAAFWMRDAETIEVICFRSVAEYAFDLLSASAKEGPVGYFTAS